MSFTKPILKALNIKEDTPSLIIGIQNEDPKIIELIYRQNFKSIQQMVRAFNFRHLEPMDIFQEGLTRAVLNVRSGKFKGNSTFSTYLYGICRFICLKEFNQPVKVVTLTNEPINQSPKSEEVNEDLIQRISVLRLMLEPPCREIIDLRFCSSVDSEIQNKLNSYEDIAHKLGIQVDLARQRLKRCLDRLRNLAINDLAILELWDN